jgi:uncharacterized OB-fold protein
VARKGHLFCYQDKDIQMSDKKPVGWECPRCGSVNAPDLTKCQCPKEVKEETKPTPQLLLE